MNIPMYGFQEIIIFLIGIPLLWILYEFFQIKSIGCQSKKNKESLKKTYSFFRQPWILKTFMIGLGKKASSLFIICSFLNNFLLILIVVAGIVHLAMPSIFLTQMLAISAGCWGIVLAITAWVGWKEREKLFNL